MKFVYLNAKTYPGITADHHYVRNLAYAFQKEVGKGFELVTINTKSEALPDLSIHSLSIPSFLKKTVFFFFWLPWFGLKNSKERLVFFSNDFNLLSILIFWKRFLRLKLVVAADWHLLSNTWKDRFVACHADYSFTTSKKLEARLQEFSKTAKIHTVYGGVDLDVFNINKNKEEIRKELGLPEDKFLVGYAGLFMTMGMEKGLSTMISALKKLPENIVMVFVGGKPDEIEHYTKEAKELGVESRSIFIPLQDFNNLVKYEKVMDALVIPYPDKPHFRNYGFPMKIYEYMASGVPMIYTKLELMEEVANDCAWGIAPDSPEALAGAVLEIQNQKEQAQKVADRAREKVAQYTWSKRAQNILKTVGMI